VATFKQGSCSGAIEQKKLNTTGLQ